MNTEDQHYHLSPGALIAEILTEEFYWTENDLAKATMLTPRHITALIANETDISEEMADLLSFVLGNSSEFWLRIDAKYRAAMNHHNANLMRKQLLSETFWITSPQWRDDPSLSLEERFCSLKEHYYRETSLMVSFIKKWVNNSAEPNPGKLQTENHQRF